MSEKRELMRTIRDEVLALSDSPLYSYRKENKYLPVIGEGNHDAKIMFIGEAPGKNEAETGKPFCGRSGKILDELLAHIDVKREDVYVANLVKDRPPGNRDPFPEEIAVYAPFLERQIDIIEPKVIATLGRFSMAFLLTKFGLDGTKGIGQLHGQVFEVKTSYGRVCLVPLYHPAAAIYNQSLLGTLKKDFEVLKSRI
jgi:DNA polymerase